MQAKKVIIASDHAGCSLKEQLISYLEDKGYTVYNYGTNDPNTPVDYPQKAFYVAKALNRYEAPFAILICGTGIGMSIAVNRYDFIRGALVCSPETARLARAHNNANVLILGGRVTDADTAKQCADIFLTTAFEGGRHTARVNQLEKMPHDF